MKLSSWPADSYDVLVIDDSEIARGAMVQALRANGIATAALPSAIGATRAILRSNIRLVVIDVNMPTMHGDKLARLFRQNKRLHELKVLLISGDDRAELKRLGEEVGADGTLTKSEIESRLVRTVRSLLS